MVQLDGCGERKGGGPGIGVHVAAYGEDWCDGFELVEDCRVADIAGMNDDVRAAQRGQSFRTEKAVGIRDEAQEERVHQQRMIAALARVAFREKR